MRAAKPAAEARRQEACEVEAERICRQVAANPMAKANGGGFALDMGDARSQLDRLDGARTTRRRGVTRCRDQKD